MNDKITLFPQPITPPGVVPAGKAARQSGPQGASFGEVLARECDNGRIGFSRHARQRMVSRNIEFSEGELARLDQAVAQVRAKGGRDSLVMLNDNALIVSARNNQVVTVVDQDSLRDNVFTNIDSAIIA